MGKVSIRETQILVELKKRGQLESKEIMELFQISESTARRMCVDLGKRGLAIRTFGGIRCLPEHSSASVAYSYDIRETEHAEMKQKIGEYASSLVEDGDIIFINGGTTVQKMAEALIERLRREELKNISILTNSIASAELLAGYCTVMLTGGRLRAERRDMAGFLSEQMVRNAHFDKCFIGVDGISMNMNGGLVALDVDTANLDGMVVDQSDAAFILADSSKFDRPCFVTYARFQSKHTIITDDRVDQKVIETAKKIGLLMHII